MKEYRATIVITASCLEDAYSIEEARTRLAKVWRRWANSREVGLYTAKIEIQNLQESSPAPSREDGEEK